MATYSGIKGFTIQSLASDPYTSTVAAGTWASGNALNTARSRIAGCGVETSGLAIAGVNGGPLVANVEKYNGTSWTEIADVNTAREAGAAATNSPSATTIFFGGNPGPLGTNSESWNDTSWSATAALNTAKGGVGGVGNSSTSALKFGGEPVAALTESWNGTSWTEVADLNTARAYCSGAGIVTAGLCIGGQVHVPTTIQQNATEQWDGTSWTEVGALTTARDAMGSCGTTTLALTYGGYGPAYSALTEAYDGTSWAEVADLTTARGSNPTSVGTQTAAVCAGGQITPGAKIATTEEWSVPSGAISIVQEGQVWYNTTSTVLKGFGKQGTGAWASGGDMNTARASNSASGNAPITAGLTFLGEAPGGVTTASETYDGSTWTTVNSALTARRNLGGAGTQTAGLAFGGYAVANKAESEEYDGTSWAEGNNLNTARRELTGCGSQTAGLAFGGQITTNSALNEAYDGTCWTEVNDLNTARSEDPGGMGTQTAALCAGGNAPPGNTANVEEYDGTSWSEGNNLSEVKSNLAAAGTTGAAIVFGGNPVSVNTETYDGTSWTEVANLATGRHNLAGWGSYINAVACAGNTPGNSAATEEWSIPDATKTFTAS